MHGIRACSCGWQRLEWASSACQGLSDVPRTCCEPASSRAQPKGRAPAGSAAHCGLEQQAVQNFGLMTLGARMMAPDQKERLANMRTQHLNRNAASCCNVAYRCFESSLAWVTGSGNKLSTVAASTKPVLLTPLEQRQHGYVLRDHSTMQDMHVIYYMLDACVCQLDPPRNHAYQATPCSRQELSPLTASAPVCNWQQGLPIIPTTCRGPAFQRRSALCTAARHTCRPATSMPLMNDHTFGLQRHSNSVDPELTRHMLPLTVSRS